jgi:hypothetical protein
MQVDWGHCGQIRVGATRRNVSVVLNGSGRYACLHPEFLGLCGHFYLEPIACERRDPESKGIVEVHVKYVKRNALAGRAEELTRWEDHARLAIRWRDEVANVRIHFTTRERPRDRFERERGALRPLPPHPFDTDEIVSALVRSRAHVRFDGNRYSVPPHVVDKTVLIRANASMVRVIHEGHAIANHARCYDRHQFVLSKDHQLEALKLRGRLREKEIPHAFDALGDEARNFRLALRRQPVKTTLHLRKLLNLARLYGREEKTLKLYVDREANVPHGQADRSPGPMPGNISQPREYPLAAFSMAPKLITALRECSPSRPRTNLRLAPGRSFTRGSGGLFYGPAPSCVPAPN